MTDGYNQTSLRDVFSTACGSWDEVLGNNNPKTEAPQHQKSIAQIISPKTVTKPVVPAADAGPKELAAAKELNGRALASLQKDAQTVMAQLADAAKVGGTGAPIKAATGEQSAGGIIMAAAGGVPGVEETALVGQGSLGASTNVGAWEDVLSIANDGGATQQALESAHAVLVANYQGEAGSTGLLQSVHDQALMNGGVGFDPEELVCEHGFGAYEKIASCARGDFSTIPEAEKLHDTNARIEKQLEKEAPFEVTATAVEYNELPVGCPTTTVLAADLSALSAMLPDLKSKDSSGVPAADREAEVQRLVGVQPQAGAAV